VCRDAQEARLLDALIANPYYALVTANVSTVLAALSDPTRLGIFERLAAGPLPVGQLARGFPVTRPAVSQHLRVLKRAGLVIDERAGTRRVYRVNPVALQEIRAYFDRFWTDALVSFKAVAEQSHRREPAHAKART
jgi:DNA-binding transcriptional ArsR family regulator